MKKTAKQMFEELGWKCEEYHEEYNKCIKYITNAGNNEKESCIITEITFDLIDKTIRFFSFDSGEIFEYYETYITPQVLKAINKQVEELGWGGKENE